MKHKDLEYHGLTSGSKQPPEYQVWAQIVQRCFNPKCRKYPRYGGRGIAMHLPWRESFVAFFEAVGPRPSSGYSIERIDNDKGYFPGNVKWATREEQARNKSTSCIVRYGGEEVVISELAERTNINKNTLWNRIFRDGLTPDKAVTAILENRKIKAAKADGLDIS
jgi:hypothetical protein